MMRYKLFTFLILAVMLFGGCSADSVEIETLADMKDMALTVGLPDDIDARDYLLEACPNADIVAQNDVMYGVRSVSEGKLDAFVVGKIYIEKAIKEGHIEGVRILEDPLHTYECGLGLSDLCDIPDYEKVVNKTIEGMIADGTIEEMRDRWFVQMNEEMPEIPLDENPAYTLKGVTYGQCQPYSYVVNGKLTGFDVELIYRICAENHWGLNLKSAEYPGMLMGLSTGKFDMISANLYFTENCDENISYSVPYNCEDISVAVHDYGQSATAEAATKLEYNSLEELNDAQAFAIETGTIFDTFVKERYPQAEAVYYQTLVDCALALTDGKVDGVVFDAPSLEYLVACNDGVALMPEYLTKDQYHFILPKSERGEQLRKEFNQWFEEQKKAGETEKLYEFWCSDETPTESPDFDALPKTNGTIKISTTISGRPDVFYYNNKPVGFPIDLMYRFCRDRGYGAKISVTSFDGVIPGIVSEKEDFSVGFISYTEERAESVLFTDAVLEGGIGVLVRTADSENDSGFLNTVKKGLHKTFVEEDRWQMILYGLGITFLITFGGFILANLLGMAFCACMMSKRKGWKIFAEVYDRIMQGTPMVVILMILYYVIFGKSDISGVWVAVLAFGLNSGASLAQQFYGAVTGVDKGQTEAALAIGFTKMEAFTGVVFPQAARTALPGYFSELINLMKGTAIVGYIAVIDLTKSGDLIRSSTYDAFFPLLSVAFIYFMISFGFLSVLKYFRKKLAPKRVKTQEVKK